MTHALTIAACVLCSSLNTAHAQQTGTYTTYVGGKAAVLDQWSATTEDDTLTDNSDIAGFVIFAGATRPLEDEWVRQYEYIYGLDSQLTPKEQAEIYDYKRQATRIKQLTTADASRKELLLYVPPSYWLDLKGYFPPTAALKLKQPLLILQGERDYNVTMGAFRDWQRVLAKRSDASFKSYPKLDHLFLEGIGPASDADYVQPRNIPKYVVDDIAAWIKKQ